MILPISNAISVPFIKLGFHHVVSGKRRVSSQLIAARRGERPQPQPPRQENGERLRKKHVAAGRKREREREGESVVVQCSENCC